MLSTLAAPNTLQSLKSGKLLSLKHTRHFSIASSSRTVAGFPCCIATAPSTLALLAPSRRGLENVEQQEQELDESSRAVKAIAIDFLTPHPRFDWRPRARSKAALAPTLSKSEHVVESGGKPDALRRRKPPKRVAPHHADPLEDQPFYHEVQAYQQQ